MLPGFPQAELWKVLNSIPAGARVNFDDAAFANYCRQAMAKWAAISDTLPQDGVRGVDEQGGNDDFGILWMDREFMANLPQSGVDKLAATESFFDDSNYPCRITSNLMYVSYQPRVHGVATDYWWGGSDGSGSCSPNCYPNEKDILVGLIHEFGHAYGLDHTQYYNSNMYPLLRNEVRYTNIDSYSKALIRRIYRDNFGPSRVQHFDVLPGTGSSVTIDWESSEDVDCRKLRLWRVDPDQSTYVLSDSIPCGFGVPVNRSFTDHPTGSGIFSYYLSAVEVSDSSVVQEIGLEDGAVEIGGPGVALAATEAVVPAEAVYAGSVAELLADLGRAWSTRNPIVLDECLADGFVDKLASGAWWDRSIERIWSRESWSCGTGEDTLKFRLVGLSGSGGRVDGLVECLFANGCSSVESSWNGLISMTFENLGRGWRIRAISELPTSTDAGNMLDSRRHARSKGLRVGMRPR